MPKNKTPDLTTAGNKKGEPEFAFLRILAEWTGLEPATPGVTGRYSNRLNYHSLAACCQLVAALYLLAGARSMNLELVGAERLELPTYAAVRAPLYQLSWHPLRDSSLAWIVTGVRFEPMSSLRMHLLKHRIQRSPLV